MRQQDKEAELLRQEIRVELSDPEEWLTSPNLRLRGRTPEQAITEGDVELVQNLLYSIIYIGVA
jgi:hypothetical protein